MEPKSIEQIKKIIEDINDTIIAKVNKILNKNTIVKDFSDFCLRVINDKPLKSDNKALNKEDLKNIFFLWYCDASQKKSYEEVARVENKIDTEYSDEDIHFYITFDSQVFLKSILSIVYDYLKNKNDIDLKNYGLSYFLYNNGFENDWVEELENYGRRAKLNSVVYADYIDEIERGRNVKENTEKALKFEKALEEMNNHYKNL